VMTAQGAFEEAVTHLRDGLSQPRAIQLRHYGVARLAEALSHIGECIRLLLKLGRDWRTKNERGSGAGSQSFIGAEASLSSVSAGSKRRKTHSKKRCALLAGSKRSRMNCAPPRASRGYGANKAGGPKRVTCSRQSTAGSPRASTPPI